MNKKAVVLGLIGCFMFVFCGCSTYSKDSSIKTTGLLEPSGTLKFSDVPVPNGFKFVPLNSYSFEATGVRVGVLRYQGKANPDMVVNFYKEQMQMYNWNLINIIEYGERLMNFERDNEICVVNLSGKGNAVTITVSLGPKSQNLPRKSKEPIK